MLGRAGPELYLVHLLLPENCLEWARATCPEIESVDLNRNLDEFSIVM